MSKFHGNHAVDVADVFVAIVEEEANNYLITHLGSYMEWGVALGVLVMTHSDVTGRCLDGKPSMSSLPYMHRNPAV